MDPGIIKLQEIVLRVKYIVDDLYSLEQNGKEIIKESYGGLINELDKAIQITRGIRKRKNKLAGQRKYYSLNQNKKKNAKNI